MNKVLIDVFVPNIDEHYNIFIPINKRINTIKRSIVQSIGELLEDNTFENLTFNMYDSETGLKFDDNVYVKDSGIKNGSKIILI